MKNTSPTDFKFALQEGFATFLLVLFATGAVVLDREMLVASGIFGASLASGLLVSIMILLFGTRSGAHINPIVSLAFYLTEKISISRLYWYLLFQLLGALSASTLLWFFFPENGTLGATLPSIGEGFSFVLEFVLAALLLILIFALEYAPETIKKFSWLWIGLLVFLEIYLFGALSGASMNPVRSLAPAILAANFQSLWIYLLAPFLATLVVVWGWKKWIS